MSPTDKPSALLQGTLDMLILKILAVEPLHSDGIGARITQMSSGTVQVHAGSLFPALRRLERDGLIKGEWRVTENNRQARWYALTTPGRARLKSSTRDWQAQSAAIALILKSRGGEA